jgi:hypothetical protein
MAGLYWALISVACLLLPAFAQTTTWQTLVPGVTYTVTNAPGNSWNYFKMPNTLTGTSYRLDVKNLTVRGDPDIYLGTSSVLNTDGSLRYARYAATADGSDSFLFGTSSTWWKGSTVYVAILAYARLTSFSILLTDTTQVSATPSPSRLPTTTGTPTRTPTRSPSPSPSASLALAPTIVNNVATLSIGGTAVGTCTAPSSASTTTGTQHYFSIAYTPALVLASGGATYLNISATPGTAAVDPNLFIAPGSWSNATAFSPVSYFSKQGAGKTEIISLQVSGAYLNGTAYSATLVNRRLFVAVNCSFGGGGSYSLRATWDYRGLPSAAPSANPTPNATPTPTPTRASPAPVVTVSGTLSSTANGDGLAVSTFTSSSQQYQYWAFRPPVPGSYRVSLTASAASANQGNGVKLCANLAGYKNLQLGTDSAVNLCSSNIDPRAELSVSLTTGRSSEVSTIYIRVQPTRTGTTPTFTIKAVNTDSIALEDTSGNEESDSSLYGDTDIPLAMPVIIGICLVGFAVLTVASAVYRRRAMRRRQLQAQAAMAAAVVGVSASGGGGPGGGGGGGGTPPRSFLSVVPSPVRPSPHGGRSSLEPVLVNGNFMPYSSSPISVTNNNDSRRSSAGGGSPAHFGQPPAYPVGALNAGGNGAASAPYAVPDLDGHSKTGSAVGGGNVAMGATTSGPGVAAPIAIQLPFDTSSEPLPPSLSGPTSVYPNLSRMIPTATVVSLPGHGNLQVSVVQGQAYNGPLPVNGMMDIPVAATVVVGPPTATSARSAATSPSSNSHISPHHSAAAAALRAYASPSIRAPQQPQETGGVTVTVLPIVQPSQLPAATRSQRGAGRGGEENKDDDDADEDDDPEYYSAQRRQSSYFGTGGVANNNINSSDREIGADPSVPSTINGPSTRRVVADL